MIELLTDGKSLTFALEKEVSKTFLELAIMCKAVICCRCYQLDILLILTMRRRSRFSAPESARRQTGQEEPQGNSSCHW